MLPVTSQKGTKSDKAQQPSFREVPVRQRSLWESWAVVPAKARLRISLALTGFALAGLFVSDQLERRIPAEKPTSKTP